MSEQEKSDMAEMEETEAVEKAVEQPAKRRYFTTMDLLTMAAIAVIGALFSSYVWNALMGVMTPVFAFLGPVGWIGASGVYMIWPVIVGQLICKPGAVTLYSFLQGFVEMLFGNPFGAMAIVYAGVEGIGLDIGMGIFRWRPKLAGAMIGGGLGSVIVSEVYIFVFGMASAYTIIVGAITAFISGAILGGLVGWLIAQALYRTGIVSRIGLTGYEALD
jgi:energy-coupling factor transport system substrate-specific component